MSQSAKKAFTLSCALMGALSSHHLIGTSETWLGGTLGNQTDLATDANWSGGALPSNPGDIAVFDTAGSGFSPTNLTASPLTLSNVLFPSADAAVYTITLGNNSHTTITCDKGGITNETGSTQTFNLSGATLALQGNSLNSRNVLLDLAGGSAVTIADQSTAVFNLTGSDPASSVNLLGTTSLVLGSANASTTYSGQILSSAAGTVTKIGTGTVALDGNNTGFSTFANQGTLAIGAEANIGTGDIVFEPGQTDSTSSTLALINNFTLPNDIQLSPQFTGIIDSGGFVTLSGAIKDQTSGGNLRIEGSITQLSNTGNTYSGKTTVAAGSELQAAESNVFSPNSAMTIEGMLCNTDGIGDFTNSIYSLSGSGQVCPGLTSVGNIRIVGQDATVFSGTLDDFGSLILDGGSLELTGNSSSSEVGVVVNATATLIQNGMLGGNVVVSADGELKGTGTILGGVMMNGTISPGNSIGTLQVGGSYIQGANTTYNAEIDRLGNSDLIFVSGAPGTAILNGGEVVVTPLGGVDFNAVYTILEAPGGITGTFAGASGSLFTPSLDYSLPGYVLLTISPSTINGASTFNQTMVAGQLDTLTAPNAEMNGILSALVLLPLSEFREALDQLGGNQHTADPFIIERLNRAFVRRLYDPIRSIVTLPCRCINPCSSGLDVWLEGSWDKAYLHNDGNGFGLNLNGYEFTLGAQQTFLKDWTIGLAGSYAHDFVSYNIGGHGKLDSGFAGLYGLYRPDYFYVLADLAFGYTSNKIRRPMFIDNLSFVADSKAPTYDLIAYAEAGMDVPFCTLLIQPFFGIECNKYWRDRTVEHGAGDINLIVYERTHTSATSRLGLHLTSTKYCDLTLSVDAAWNYRLTCVDPDFWHSFLGFESFFLGRGVHTCRSSGEGAITLTNQINSWWSFYLQASGEVWSHASSYSALAGIQASW